MVIIACRMSYLTIGGSSGFVDLDCAGVGDRHVDVYWALWTLWFNLHTDAYGDRLLDAYGRDLIDMRRCGWSPPVRYSDNPVPVHEASIRSRLDTGDSDWTTIRTVKYMDDDA
ncbi:MAG: phosphotransferase [Bifidobacterium pseudocatenulatum]